MVRYVTEIAETRSRYRSNVRTSIWTQLSHLCMLTYRGSIRSAQATGKPHKACAQSAYKCTKGMHVSLWKLQHMTSGASVHMPIITLYLLCGCWQGDMYACFRQLVQMHCTFILCTCARLCSLLLRGPQMQGTGRKSSKTCDDLVCS